MEKLRTAKSDEMLSAFQDFGCGIRHLSGDFQRYRLNTVQVRLHQIARTDLQTSDLHCAAKIEHMRVCV